MRGLKAMKFGKHICSIVFVLILADPENQSVIQNSRDRRSVSIPRDILLPVSVYQPDSPLKLTYVDMRKPLSRGNIFPLVIYRNESRKSIKGYSISLGGGNILTERDLPKEEWIHPNKELIIGEPANYPLVPLSDELRKELDLQGTMWGLWPFMILRVEFSDGSVYDDTKTHNSLRTYYEQFEKYCEEKRKKML
jgi:hypothetical protein